MAVYYQTYRPKNFKEVVGQEAMLKALQNASDGGYLGHAYLFTGGRGLGKTTLARILAKAVNCPKVKAGDPCGKCEVCLSVATGNFLDVIEIDAASHTGVDNIRELIENINFQPSYGKTKVFIIDEVHMLSKAAFNALLKTLEEPPDHAMFILATTDVHKVPETIISRTQRFDFRSINNQDIKKVLTRVAKEEKLTLPEGSIDLIVENSEGGLRDALSQLGTIAVLPKTASFQDVNEILGTSSSETIFKLLSIINQGNSAALPDFFEQQTSRNFDATSFSKQTLKVLQQLLEASLSGKKFDSTSNHEVGRWTVPQLLLTTRLFLRAHKEVDRAVSPELPLLLASIEATAQFSENQDKESKEETVKTSLKSEMEPAKAKTKPDDSNIINTATNPLDNRDREVIKSAETIDENNLVSDSATEMDSLTSSAVEQWWPKLIEQVKNLNSPLSTLLKNSPIDKISGRTVTVAVKYLFHKENLENTKHRAIITDLAGDLAGGPVGFKVVIKKTDQEDSVPSEVVLTDAIKIFGGELIE